MRRFLAIVARRRVRRALTVAGLRPFGLLDFLAVLLLLLLWP
jgi:hypothetical protein